MLPRFEVDNILEDLPEVPIAYGNKTYKIDWITKTVSGYINEVEALRQSIECVMRTERYEYNIYSYDYGTEFKGLIGQDPLFIKADLHRRVEEALLQDGRIISVEALTLTSEGENIVYEGRVETVFGDIEITKEVI